MIIYTYSTYLMKAKKETSARLTTQPAVANALGMVKAPVPTIMLNIYTKPTYTHTDTQKDSKRALRFDNGMMYQQT